jgi:hypothetical protein
MLSQYVSSPWVLEVLQGVGEAILKKSVSSYIKKTFLMMKRMDIHLPFPEHLRGYWKENWVVQVRDMLGTR